MSFSDLRYKASIGMETVYNDGGASFTDIPLANTGKPKIGKKYEVTIPVYGGTLAQQKKYVALQTYQLPLSFYLKGSGTAGTPSEMGKLLRCMGLTETVNSPTNVIYSPRDTGQESGALKVNLDGVQYLMTGFRGSELVIPLKGGEKVVCTGTIESLFSIATSVGYTAPSYTDVAIVPPTVQSIALTIGGNTFIIPEITFKLQTKIEVIPNVNAANNGINEIAQTLRTYNGDFLVERDANNDIEFWTAWINSTEQAVASTGFGSAGNEIALSCSNLQIIDVEPVVQYNRPYYKVMFQINYNATLANEFSLTFK